MPKQNNSKGADGWSVVTKRGSSSNTQKNNNNNSQPINPPQQANQPTKQQLKPKQPKQEQLKPKPQPRKQPAKQQAESNRFVVPSPASTSNVDPSNVPSLLRIAYVSLAKMFETTPSVENLEAILNLTNPTLIKMVFDSLSVFAVEPRALIRRLAPDYITPLNLIKAINAAEIEYLNQLDNGVIPKFEYTLIDVWKEYDTFVLAPIRKDEYEIGCLFYGNRPYRPAAQNTKIEHSIPNKETFQYRFNAFTEDLFVGWTEWANMMVVGGTMTACLSRVPDAYNNNVDQLKTFYHKKVYVRSDIDVYIYGLQPELFAEKIYRFYRFLTRTNADVAVIKTPNTITFVTGWPKRHIQVVIGQWKTKEAVLFDADIDVTAVAYDGYDLWATQRARFGYNHRCTVADPRKEKIRGCTEFVERLIKYSRRGYYVWDPQMDKISKRRLEVGKERIIRHGNESFKYNGVTGLRLLLCGIKYADELKDIDFFKNKENKFKDDGLPYGPKWNVEKTRKKALAPMVVMSTYGPCKVPNECKLVTPIVDRDSIFHPVNERLQEIDKTIRKQQKKSQWYSKILFEADKKVIYKRIHTWFCVNCHKYITDDNAFITTLCKCLFCPKCHTGELNCESTLKQKCPSCRIKLSKLNQVEPIAKPNVILPKDKSKQWGWWYDSEEEDLQL